VAQIGAALASGTAAASAAHAEQIVEYVGEGRGEVGTEAVRRSAHAAVLECRVAEAIIGRTLVGVLEDLVGLVDLLEAMLGVAFPGIAVRVPLHRLFAKRSFDVAIACGALDRQSLVVAALGHHSPPDDVQSSPFKVQDEGCQVKNMHPRFASGGAILTDRSGIERLAGSSRFLVLLVVVDFGELSVDYVFLLAFGRSGTAGAAGRLLGGLLVHRLAELQGSLCQRIGLRRDWRHAR